ncbi:MAG: hypothetical protein SGI84_13120 [Gemmatimonadota bacterium]|nr:hypothetical protein [Gemmatimonadota bacterium]
MKPAANLTLAVLAGLVVGGVVNMAIVAVGPMIVPLPEGADVSTSEGLAAALPLFRPINFLPPFLAHALGTLAGAFVAAKVAATHRVRVAVGIGAIFLLGGIAAIKMMGGPLWFTLLDLVGAYLPMGYLGAVLAGATRTRAA